MLPFLHAIVFKLLESNYINDEAAPHALDSLATVLTLYEVAMSQNVTSTTTLDYPVMSPNGLA